MKEFSNNIASSDSATHQPTSASTTASSSTKKMITNTRLVSTTTTSKEAQLLNGLASPETTSTAKEDDTLEYMEVEENVPTITDEEMMKNQQATSLSDVPALMKRPLQVNEYWYLLDKQWYDSFLVYLENPETNPNPGRIDNNSIICPAKNILSRNGEPIIYKLKPNLQENHEFVVVPEEVWNLLVQTFGVVIRLGGQEIRCPIIMRTETYLQVELYPLEIRLVLYGSKEDMVVQYSRSCTLKEVIADMKRLFKIDENKPVQLWNNATLLISHSDMIQSSTANASNTSSLSSPRPIRAVVAAAGTPPPPPPPPPPPLPPPPPPSSSKNNNSVTNLNKRLLDIGDLEAANTVLTIEVENNDHTWPSSKTKLGAVTRSKLASGVPNCPPGVCGLMNLGNTCFMNAALQCLSNTAPLTKYFLSDNHVADINPDNPLGMRGEIARCYSELIKSMWSGYHSNISPREFKIVVTQFAPQFSGFAHHDCQELMAFLLDGLHEDLNRVKVKPYIEMKNDIERRPDEIVSAEAWKNYKLRNDSIIVDTFHAQLKSTLVCPECELVSVTFDPFCYLTLPLPYRIERSVDIIFVPASSQRPTYSRNPLLSASTSNEFILTTTYAPTPVRSILLENIMIPKTGCASDISAAVAKFLNECNPKSESTYFNKRFDPKKLIVANIMDHRLNKIYSSNDLYNSHFDDIVVYEMDDLHTNSNNESGCQTRSSAKFSGHHLPVFIRQVNADRGEGVICRPFFINIRCLTYESIKEAIFKELTVMVSPDKVDYFLKEIEEPIVEKQTNAMQRRTRNRGGGGGGGGSDGETSDIEEDEVIKIPVNSNENESEDDEGIDSAFSGSSGNSFSSKRNATFPAYTISTVLFNGQNVLQVLSPGVRLESSSDITLAINLHYRLVTKFFPNNLNRSGFVRMSSLLSNSTPTNTNSLLTLKECINQFTLTEKLGENDPWYCPRCKKHQMASKKFDIWSLPNNLIIHLKRFSYSRLHRDKLNVLVEFPVENLDMTPYVLHNPNNESFVYDLIAVSNHYGELGAGHYTAFGKNFLSNGWFLFDDYSVSPVADKNKVMTKAAYVLFYQRKQPLVVQSENINNNLKTSD